MKNYYFEIHPEVAPPEGQYYVHRGIREKDLISHLSWKVMERSNRVWEEHDSGLVVFIKNRFIPVQSDVDMEEFFWVKMRSIGL